MVRWDLTDLGAEDKLQDLRLRFGPLPDSSVRLEAWCRENGRLPVRRHTCDEESELAWTEDTHAKVLGRLRQKKEQNCAEVDLLLRLQEVEKQAPVCSDLSSATLVSLEAWCQANGRLPFRRKLSCELSELEGQKRITHRLGGV